MLARCAVILARGRTPAPSFPPRPTRPAVLARLQPARCGFQRHPTRSNSHRAGWWAPPGAGQTVPIPVTITPAGASGTVVNGNLYVDDSASAVPPYGQTSGDEMAAI